MRTSTKRRHLLNLPVTVRARILEIALVHLENVKPLTPGRVIYEQGPVYVSAHGWSNTVDHIPLSSTCHQLRREAIPIYYTANDFLISIDNFNAAEVLPWWSRVEAVREKVKQNPIHIATGSGQLRRLQQGTILLNLNDQPNWSNLVEWLRLYHEGQIFSFKACDVLATLEIEMPIAGNDSIKNKLVGITAAFQSIRELKRDDLPWDVVKKMLGGIRTFLIRDNALWRLESDLSEEDEELLNTVEIKPDYFSGENRHNSLEGDIPKRVSTLRGSFAERKLRVDDRSHRIRRRDSVEYMAVSEVALLLDPADQLAFLDARWAAQGNISADEIDTSKYADVTWSGGLGGGDALCNACGSEHQPFYDCLRIKEKETAAGDDRLNSAPINLDFSQHTARETLPAQKASREVDEYARVVKENKASEDWADPSSTVPRIHCNSCHDEHHPLYDCKGIKWKATPPRGVRSKPAPLNFNFLQYEVQDVHPAQKDPQEEDEYSSPSDEERMSSMISEEVRSPVSQMGVGPDSGRGGRSASSSDFLVDPLAGTSSATNNIPKNETFGEASLFRPQCGTPFISRCHARRSTFVGSGAPTADTVNTSQLRSAPLSQISNRTFGRDDPWAPTKMIDLTQDDDAQSSDDEAIRESPALASRKSVQNIRDDVWNTSNVATPRSSSVKVLPKEQGGDGVPKSKEKGSAERKMMALRKYMDLIRAGVSDAGARNV